MHTITEVVREIGVINHKLRQALGLTSGEYIAATEGHGASILSEALAKLGDADLMALFHKSQALYAEVDQLTPEPAEERASARQKLAALTPADVALRADIRKDVTESVELHTKAAALGGLLAKWPSDGENKCGRGALIHMVANAVEQYLDDNDVERLDDLAAASLRTLINSYWSEQP